MFHKINSIVLLPILLFFSLSAKGQISQGGEPYSANLEENLRNPTKYASNQDLPVIRMPEVDNELLVQKNADINENEIFIYATHFDCDVDVKKVAITDSLRTGILYRCAIESHTAYSISVVFHPFV